MLYDEDMINGNQKRKERNELILFTIRKLQNDMPRPKRKIEDPDCPTGVCPPR
jgi:hypothetical protein